MKKLIVWSVDALFTSDLTFAATLPGFQEIMNHSVVCKDIMGIYPTLTYPCHTSIVTGEHPSVHGIIHNEKLCPQTNNAKWYWDYRDIKVKTIFDHIKAQGLRTAAINWPVTANAPIDYLVPEIWATDIHDDETTVLKSVSKNIVPIVERNLHLRSYRSYPQMDEFVQACTLDIMKEYEPDVIFLHQANLDHERHEHGIHGSHIETALRLQDQWIQEVIQVLKQQGTYEETVFIILGDHGQLDIQQNICLNSILHKEHFIQLQDDGNIQDVKAYVQSAGISAHVYVHDSKYTDQVKSILEEYRDKGYLKYIFSSEVVKPEHEDFVFVIEAEDGYAFSNQITDDVIETIDISDYKTGAATHGHLPTRGECPPFIIHHSKLTNGIVDGGNLIDEAATILDILQIHNVSMTGKSLLKNIHVAKR